MGLLSRFAGWLNRHFSAATPNNPSFNMNDSAAWDEYFGRANTDLSGVKITRDIALSNAAWWRGINLIARDVGKLPLFVYQRLGNGKERSPEHPAYRLLRHKPNSWQVALQFRMQLTAHALEEGNGYGYIVRRGDGSPEEILPLDPAATWPIKANGSLWYATRIDLGESKSEERKLPAEDVLHIKGLGYDGLIGYPCRQMAREELGLAIAQRRYQSVFFKNDATPSVLFEAPGPMPAETIKTFLARWQSLNSGLDNKHKAAVATHGMKASKLSNTARESQLTEGRAMQVREIATFLGVPPHKVGDNSRTAYASLEQENLSYLVDCLDFWLCVWEAECADKLLSEREKETDSHVVEFLRQALVRADLTSRANFYRTALGGRPWMVPDEVRNLENLNALGGTFAEALDPLNMGQGGQDNQPSNSKPAPKDDAPTPDDEEEDVDAQTSRLALKAAFSDTITRMVRRIGNSAERAAKVPASFIQWIDEINSEHRDVVSSALEWAQPLARESIADWTLASIKTGLLEFAGSVTPKTMADAIGKEIQRLEREIPAAAVAKFFASEPLDYLAEMVRAIKPSITVNVPPMPTPVVNVEAPAVHVAASPAPIVNVSPPVVNVAPPVVNVAAKPSKRTAKKQPDGTWEITEDA